MTGSAPSETAYSKNSTLSPSSCPLTSNHPCKDCRPENTTMTSRRIRERCHNNFSCDSKPNPSNSTTKNHLSFTLSKHLGDNPPVCVRPSGLDIGLGTMNCAPAIPHARLKSFNRLV